MKRNNFISILFVISSLALSACGPNSGFRADDSESAYNDGSGGVPNPSSPSWEKVTAFQGVASGGAYDQTLVVYIDKSAQSILLVLPIPAIVPMFSDITLRDLPGGKLTTFKNADGSYSLAVSIPLTYIARGATFLPDQRLPSGDPLPYVPSGELPGFAIQFPQKPQYRINVYIGVSVAAVFVELPDLGLPFGWLTRVKNKEGTKEVGAIGYVPEKGTYAGGMYLATQLPPEIAILIDELIRW